MLRSSLTSPRAALPAPSAVVELLKPITWFAPMWALMCGAVSSGQPIFDAPWLVVGAIILAGPLVCGTSQAVNDWFDREVDAINEPGRPIPSGRIPGQWGLTIAYAMSGLSLAVAALLGTAVFAATIVGLVLAWAYSAPPLRLKLNGWWGNAACAACYEGLAWFTGAAVLLGAVPPVSVMLLAALYSFGAHGIMTLNDFKSIEGDQHLGVRTLPVQLGIAQAARVACVVMVLPQAVVAALLWHWSHDWAVVGIIFLIAAQFALMPRFLSDPRRFAPWYNATGTTLFVIGMLISAIAVGTSQAGVM
ncbi:MAG: chlorophyll synthase ChlG [Pseudomonadota bacterium]